MTAEDKIFKTLYENKELAHRLETVDHISVVCYNNQHPEIGLTALFRFLTKLEIDAAIVERVVFLGIKNLSDNPCCHPDIVHALFPETTIVTYAKPWNTIAPEDIYVDSPLVIHLADNVGEAYEDSLKSKILMHAVNYLVDRTRLVGAIAVVGDGETKPEIISNFDLDSFVFTEAKCKLLSDFCVSKQKDIRRYRNELTPQSALKACIEEAQHGCEECCMVDNYGKAKICPLAQHEVALMYRQEEKEAAKSLSHQLDRLSAYQGYEPSQIQLADNLAEGCGCEKDVFAALSIYKRHAHNGNTACCDKIIELADKEEEISKLVALPWIIRQANDGDLDKASELAKIFEEGTYGVPVNHDYSRKWQIMLAESGDDKYIAELMKQAKNRQDWKESIKWNRKLRDLDSEYFDSDSYAEAKLKYIHSIATTPYSLYTRGKAFLMGSAEEKDVELAELCLIASAETGYLPAQEYLCEEYSMGRLPKDYKKSVYWGDKALEQGSKAVRFRLAWLYDDQSGVTPDYEKSHRLYKELAKEGNSAAMNNLGWMCSRGHFYTVNYKKAYEWYLKAAEAGDDVGARNVAYYYKYGTGTDKNESEAFKWFLVAANKGDKSAIKQLIECYKNGFGVERDSAKVIEWYEKLIDAGDKDAVVDLGYYYGTVILDYDKALIYYRKAAESGHRVAQYNMGIMYQEGKGVESDENTAIYWYRKSAIQGYASAQNKLKEMDIDWLEKDDE